MDSDVVSEASDSDEGESPPPTVNDTEELSNVLQRAKESDKLKGRAVSKQMVGVDITFSFGN